MEISVAAEDVSGLDRLVSALRSRTLPPRTPVLTQRAALEAAMAGMPEPYADRIPVDAGGTPAEWLYPPAAPTKTTLVYLHGGAFGMGSLATGRPLAINLGRVARSRVLNVAYRVAPEYRYPHAVEDVVAAYAWLVDQGVPPESIAFAGDSAGGGLVISTLLAARDRGLPMPAAAVCISPWVDLTLSSDSVRSNPITDPAVTVDDLQQFADSYLGDTDPREPLASPCFADLSGLPPLLIQAGGGEALLDDSRQLTDAAEQSGVSVTLEVWEDMFHVWHFYGPRFRTATRALMHIGEWLRPRLADVTPPHDEERGLQAKSRITEA